MSAEPNLRRMLEDDEFIERIAVAAGVPLFSQGLAESVTPAELRKADDRARAEAIATLRADLSESFSDYRPPATDTPT